ncbi:MAG: ribbon-helix-helix domain-containing protein [Treponema sp.]|jgi:Arc/MetJ-type ribon-helix-helix transcriptional regulator|nr:ribbon-helix-helix domain-containing protein [Treponema sp.]
MTTVRLPIEMEQRLASTSKIKHKSKSELIKEALEKFFFQEDDTQDSYKSGEAYFGKYGSGNGNLSTNYKNLLKEKLNAKYRTH